MKTTQSILLLAILLAASHAQAQEPAAAPQQNLTFPPQPVVNNQVYYPGVAPTGPQFPNQAYMQKPPMAYPYAVQQPYAAPSYYYPYAQQQQAYRPYYYPYPQQQQMMTPYPMRQPMPMPQKKETHAWGDTRYLWPDFYTDFTGDFWDKMINAPYDMGRMPGGWQFPSISTPDPVTVSDAIANQVPPFAEEAAKMVPADDVGNMRPF
ncbi:MAG: hypothetical protein RL122_1748 [Pseudomonadota bacterium]|jgi:hypothetical protein|uniref:Uncharacterized protein n=1 Tax=Thiothrix fructosivorans TaxID=111770 RepID=A0A8B0SFF5_9GAMM|nr:hypothetical protein [Thiothrix fructosivorans]MBO0614682.1 hypothetical protein [Thiothrix fructosivorans]QTX09505.1 hypothetical protein J1836_012810 [Thiothrix fructosivorans]